jgi:hypothetical protein
VWLCGVNANNQKAWINAGDRDHRFFGCLNHSMPAILPFNLFMAMSLTFYRLLYSADPAAAHHNDFM